MSLFLLFLAVIFSPWYYAKKIAYLFIGLFCSVDSVDGERARLCLNYVLFTFMLWTSIAYIY